MGAEADGPEDEGAEADEPVAVGVGRGGGAEPDGAAGGVVVALGCSGVDMMAGR